MGLAGLVEAVCAPGPRTIWISLVKRPEHRGHGNPKKCSTHISRSFNFLLSRGSGVRVRIKNVFLPSTIPSIVWLGDTHSDIHRIRRPYCTESPERFCFGNTSYTLAYSGRSLSPVLLFLSQCKERKSPPPMDSTTRWIIAGSVGGVVLVLTIVAMIWVKRGEDKYAKTHVTYV